MTHNPKPQTDLCLGYCHCTHKSREAVEQGHADVWFRDLTFYGSDHHALAQAFARTDSLTQLHVMSQEKIRELSDCERLSQSVFARYMDVRKNLVSDWEGGVKKPGGPALRLLAIVKKNGIQSLA